MDIQLNLINQSNDSNNSQIVIFQKNGANDLDDLPVAWRVIENLGLGDHHPFVYPLDMTVAAADSLGSYTPQLVAQNGQLFAVTSQSTGAALGPVGAASSRDVVEVRNDLRKGSMSACLYKDGHLLALKSAVAPQQLAVFQFKPVIWIGVAQEIEAGQVMNSAVQSAINTQISLLGIRSADIVMTGGGPGRDASAYRFALQNVTYG